MPRLITVQGKSRLATTFISWSRNGAIGGWKAECRNCAFLGRRLSASARSDICAIRIREGQGTGGTKSVSAQLLLPQLRILLRRQVQPDPALLLSDGILDLAAAGNIQRKATALRHFPYFLVIFELNRPGQGSLQILFEELAEPAFPKHE